MPIPINLELYNTIKKEADRIYSKSSAYKSGYIVKEYKKRGGEYRGKKTNTGLTRWYKEQWKDIGNKSYPVYRPTKRITKDTPLTASEIDPIQAVKQIALKQKIRGNQNLPKFEGGADEPTTPPRRRQRQEPTPPQRRRRRTEEPQQTTLIAPPLFQGIPDAPNQAPFQIPNIPMPTTTFTNMVQNPPITFPQFQLVLPNQDVFNQPQLISDLLGLPSPRSVADLHFTGDGRKRKPQEFKKSIQHVFDLLAIRGNYNIIGSAPKEEILYYSDFDLSTYQKVSLQSIKKIFQNKFKEAEKDPNIFITDFKCGEVDGEPVRWNKKNIKTGKQIVDGKEITLEECFLMPSTIKMDIVALIDGEFTEFSDNYYLSVNGVKNYDEQKKVSKNVNLKELEKSAEEYYNDKPPNYLKYLKRVYSIKTMKGQSTKKLVDFFNSQVGIINKSKTDLETLILVLENNFRKPKLEDICNNIQIIKQNITGVSEVELKPTLHEDLDKICSYKNQTSIIKNLKKVINYIQDRLNETTLHFIKKNKI